MASKRQVTLSELQDRVDSAQQIVDNLDKAIKFGRQYTLSDGRTVSDFDYAEMVTTAKSDLRKAQKAAQEPFKTRDRVQQIQNRIEELRQIAESGRQGEKATSDARIELNKLQRELPSLQQKVQSFQIPVQSDVATTPIAPTPTTQFGRAADINAVLRQSDMVGAPTPQPKQKQTKNGVLGSRKTSGRRQQPTTPETAPVTETKASAWLQAAKAEYGWVASLYETDDSIRQLLDTAVANNYTGDKFLTEFYKTSWYANTDATTRNFYKLKNSDGYAEKLDNTKNNIRAYALGQGFNFNDDTLSLLAEGQLKYGWNEQATANAIGAEFVRQADAAEAQGKLLTGQTDIKTTGVFQELKRTASQYLLKPSDAELEDYARGVITGTKTKETFNRDMAARAKIRYSSLSDYIDQGYNLQAVTADYRQTAAKLLETDENSIDFTDEKYAKAFQYTDPTTNKPRQMNLQEWQRYIRSMPEWGNTENAKNTYRDVAFSIAQAFGQVQ